jgi:hypothetical protein
MGSTFDKYTITPRSVEAYSGARGVTDYTQIGMFEQYERGYQFLSVLSLPKCMTENSSIKDMNNAIQLTMEREFRGLDGLPDVQADFLEITDGVNTQRMINKVNSDTSIEVSMNFFEKHGGLWTRYIEYYLSGIRDPKTQARTYHGLIADNILEPAWENEVFTLMYYVTDSTMLRLERAFLLANCQFTSANVSMYNGSRDNISNNELTVNISCFPIWNEEVNKAAKYLLEHTITGQKYNYNPDDKNRKFSPVAVSSAYDDYAQAAVLDSLDYEYGILHRDGTTNTFSDSNLGSKLSKDLAQAKQDDGA